MAFWIKHKIHGVVCKEGLVLSVPHRGTLAVARSLRHVSARLTPSVLCFLCPKNRPASHPARSCTPFYSHVNSTSPESPCLPVAPPSELSPSLCSLTYCPLCSGQVSFHCPGVCLALLCGVSAGGVCLLHPWPTVSHRVVTHCAWLTAAPANLTTPKLSDVPSSHLVG